MKLKIKEKIEKADVLIIGGGIGGLQAAISAGEKGASVIVAEKANVKRSGNGSTGTDHFVCYISEIHGDDIRLAMRELKSTIAGPNQDEIMQYTLLSHTKELIDMWHSYGINMKPSGDYVFEGHALQGRQRYYLKYDGRNQKECLTREAKQRGAVFHNHVIIYELLTDSDKSVIGAIGVDISDDEPKLVIYQVKSAILATGPAARMFPPSVPAYMFNTNDCPACTGGAVIGYRAGARLINYDLINRHAGTKYFERGGKATWLGKLCTSDGKQADPFKEPLTREYGEPLLDIWPGIYADKFRDGTGPVYMNCTMLSEEDLSYMTYCFETEGITSITDCLE